MVANRLLLVLALGAMLSGASASSIAYQQRGSEGEFPAKLESDDAEWGEIDYQSHSRRQDTPSGYIKGAPYQCKGKADRPHYSTDGDKKGKSEITAKAWIDCVSRAHELYATNQISGNHIGWWGWREGPQVKRISIGTT